MASGGNDNLSDEVFNFTCTACVKLNKHKKAVKYCVECQGYCCQSCVDMHGVIPALEKHSLLDKSNSNLSAFKDDLPEVPTVRCGEHRVKIIDMYCGNHDAVGCTTCMSLNHRNCRDVRSIPDDIDSVFRETDLTDIKEKLLKASKLLSKIKESKECLLVELQKSKMEALNAIKTFRKEMELLLEDLEKASIQLVEKNYSQAEITLSHEKKKAEQETGILRTALDDLQRADANRAQRFVFMKTAQRKISETENCSHSLQNRADVKIKFSPDISIRNSLQNTQTFGSITFETVSTGFNSQRNTLYSVKDTREMKVRSNNDNRTCWICGSCLADDGLLLLSDNNNKNLKQADIVKMSLLDTCELPNGPKGVCFINKQEAAVSLNNRTIQFVSLSNRLTCTKQLKLDHCCEGIAFKNNRLYVTDNSSQLYIHDMSGNLLQTISGKIAGNNMFQYSRHIAFDDDGSNLLIADGTGLVTVDLNGKHMSKFNHADLRHSNGVCTDRRGNVFVCGYLSNNVVQIHQSDNRKLGVVVKYSDGVEYPLSVCFNPSQSVLVVTQRNDDTIKLFDLQ